MVQDDKDNFVPTTTLPGVMMARTATKTSKAATRSAFRIGEDKYQEIAKSIRNTKEAVSVDNFAYYATIILEKRFPKAEVTEERIGKVNGIIRQLDAAEAAKAKEKIAGTVAGMKNGEMADLILKSIVKDAVKAGTLETAECVRKLLLAQEARFEKRLHEQNQRFEKILSAMCVEWGIRLPDLEPVKPIELLPEVDVLQLVVRTPRILIYGMQANQKQPIFDKINEWDLKGVANVDIEYSTTRVASVKRGYDVVIVNRHWVGVDDIRELESHGAKFLTVRGAMSAVTDQLKSVLLEYKIEKVKQQEQAK